MKTITYDIDFKFTECKSVGKGIKAVGKTGTCNVTVKGELDIIDLAGTIKHNLETDLREKGKFLTAFQVTKFRRAKK